MLNLNRAQVLGNCTRDAEMRYTPNGHPVASFTVATNRRWTSADGTQQDATEYHDIVVWGKQAENVSPMLKKGTPAFVEGRLQTRSWEGQDGVKRYKTEIVADNVIVLSSRGSALSSSPDDAETQENPIKDIAEEKSDSKGKKEVKEEEIDIEEIPF
jgi:single-strand DNA-binding protein